jgi:hypothetical protein
MDLDSSCIWRSEPALLEVLGDRGFGLGQEPVVVYARRLSPDVHTDMRAAPAPVPRLTTIHHKRQGDPWVISAMTIAIYRSS